MCIFDYQDMNPRPDLSIENIILTESSNLAQSEFSYSTE